MDEPIFGLAHTRAVAITTPFAHQVCEIIASDASQTGRRKTKKWNSTYRVPSRVPTVHYAPFTTCIFVQRRIACIIPHRRAIGLAAAIGVHAWCIVRHFFAKRERIKFCKNRGNGLQWTDENFLIFVSIRSGRWKIQLDRKLPTYWRIQIARLKISRRFFVNMHEFSRQFRLLNFGQVWEVQKHHRTCDACELSCISFCVKCHGRNKKSCALQRAEKS